MNSVLSQTNRDSECLPEWDGDIGTLVAVGLSQGASENNTEAAL